jgi:sodium/hydrogen antiporter
MGSAPPAGGLRRGRFRFARGREWVETPVPGMTLLTIFIALLFLHSLVSGRLERTVLTAPIVFTAAGMLALCALSKTSDAQVSHELFLSVAEIGLVLLLFTDASRTDLRVLRNIRNLPARLLSAGMLLTLLLGVICARVVFPNLSLWEAGILAAILAPTDAGLGQIIVNSPRVPLKIRQALNVEAGLNDGLSVPFLLFFIALAGGAAEGGHSSLTRFILEQLGLGTLVGLSVGLVGGWLLGVAHARGWMAHSWQQLGVVALPLLCLLASETVGASMFIAAFVAGLAVQVGFSDAAKHSVEFTEGWGQLLNLSVFFLFGLLVARAWPQFSWRHALYAVLSLTVVRMLPVAVALTGTRLCRASVLFMGWFGPRGLASIVLGLVYLEQTTHQPGESAIRLAVMITVLFSIIAHGMSALPGMELYARTIGTLPAGAPELEGSDAEIAASNAMAGNSPNH